MFIVANGAAIVTAACFFPVLLYSEKSGKTVEGLYEPVFFHRWEIKTVEKTSVPPELRGCLPEELVNSLPQPQGGFPHRWKNLKR